MCIHRYCDEDATTEAPAPEDKVAYVLATSMASTYKLASMILPQLEQGTHGADAAGIFFFMTTCSAYAKATQLENVLQVLQKRRMYSSWSAINVPCGATWPRARWNSVAQVLRLQKASWMKSSRDAFRSCTAHSAAHRRITSSPCDSLTADRSAKGRCLVSTTRSGKSHKLEVLRL